MIVTQVTAAVRQYAISLRDYQEELTADVYAAWQAGAANVLAVLPTGGGKTVIFGRVVADHAGASCALAHRQELVGQISLALARYGVRHRIIGPQNVIRRIVQEHMGETGCSYYDPSARTAVAGVDTLVARAEQLTAWAATVTLWVTDEAHHTLASNKWGKAAALFPNAKGLGVTATPARADGKGLGRHAEGVFDDMVEGPSARWLIEQGYLCDYRIIAPPGDFVRPGADAVGSTGDIKLAANKAAVKASHIMGDVVTHYQRFAAGRRGIVFAVDVETATEIARNFNAAGVRAEAVSAKTADNVRGEMLARFKRGELDVLVNVDLFGEGFDLPALDVVIMARATESLGLYLQQFGRALRPIYAPGYDLSTREGRLAAIAAGPKPRALIVDHVGNVVRHLLPDSARVWGLDGRGKKTRGRALDVVPLRTCLNLDCLAPYERALACCPFCGHKPEPANRSAPEFVDGDLLELDAEALKRLRGDIEKIDGPARVPQHLDGPAVGALHKRHRERQQAQEALRTSIAWWAGYQRALGRPDSESYRRFYLAFGLDVMSAQALGRPEALALADKINNYLGEVLG